MIVMDKFFCSAISLGHFLGACGIETWWLDKSNWRPWTSSVGITPIKGFSVGLQSLTLVWHSWIAWPRQPLTNINNKLASTLKYIVPHYIKKYSVLHWMPWSIVYACLCEGDSGGGSHTLVYCGVWRNPWSWRLCRAWSKISCIALSGLKKQIVNKTSLSLERCMREWCFEWVGLEL